MLISDKYKLAFIHIPKTGGSSIRNMIRAVDPKCYEYKEHHSVLTESDAAIFSNYFKFAVVRNSYKLCASFYRFMTEKIGNLDERQKPVGMINLIEGQITETKDSTAWQLSQIKNPFPIQMDWYSKDEKVFVDEVYVYDKDLDSQMKNIKEKLNFKKNLDKSNYYKEYDWRSYYDAESIEYVTRVCQKDINHFNFKFKEN